MNYNADGQTYASAKLAVPKSGIEQLNLLVAADIDPTPRRNRPCPNCGGNDRFTLFDTGRHFCRGCGGGDSIDLIRKVFGCSFREALAIGGGSESHVEKSFLPLYRVAQPQTPAAKIERAKKIIAQSKPLTENSEVWRYLTEARRLPDEVISGCNLREIERLAYYEQDADGKNVLAGYYRAMVAPVVNGVGNVVAVHVTYLQGAQKALIESPKKIIGAPKGGVIRLSPAEGGEVGLAEGIETAIAARAIFNVPVWSFLSASLAPFIELPDTIKRVHIFADNDDAGMKATAKLKARAAELGARVGMCKKPSKGKDFQEILKHETREREARNNED